MTPRAFLVLVVLAGGVLAGCGAPDRETEADALERAVGAMPGVEKAFVVYSNNVSQGSEVSIDVRVPEASPSEVEAVAEQVAEAFERDFEDFEQAAKFGVEGGVSEYRPAGGEDELELDPGQVGRDVEAVRRLVERLGSVDPGRQVRWEHHGDEAEMSLTTPATPIALAAVREAVGEQEVRALFPALGRGTVWTVRYPFSAEDEAQVRARLERIDPAVTRVRVEGPRIAVLEVLSPSSAQPARTELEQVVRAIEPSVEHPLMLVWDESPGVGGQEQRFRGSVHVAGCGYDDTWIQTEPEKFLTDEALTLQKQLRQEYDAC